MLREAVDEHHRRAALGTRQGDVDADATMGGDPAMLDAFERRGILWQGRDEIGRAHV